MCSSYLTWRKREIKYLIIQKSLTMPYKPKTADTKKLISYINPKMYSFI